MKDLPNLDLLRSVAVLLVVLEHTLMGLSIPFIGSWEVRWMGVVGVFMFFVHTALVLMWSLERKPHTLDFYVRRVFRIYPLSVCTVLLTVLLHVAASPVPGAVYSPPNWRQVIYSLLLVQNLHGGNTIVGVLWTLPFEVEMYILLPFLFFFVRKNFSLWPLLLIWGLLIDVDVHLFSSSNNSLPVVIAYFLPGVMAYVGFGRRRPVLPAWVLPAFLGVLLAGFMVHPGWRRAWVLCLALGLLLPSFRQIRAVWLKTCSRELAKYSYGIYLAHPFSLAIGLVGLHGHSVLLQLTVAVATLVVFAYAAYHLIEAPMIRQGSNLAARLERRYEQHESGEPRRQPA